MTDVVVGLDPLLRALADPKGFSRARGPRCVVCALLEPGQLTERARGRLLEVLRDVAWESEALAKALTESGYRVGASSVSRHRRGGCLGGRGA